MVLVFYNNQKEYIRYIYNKKHYMIRYLLTFANGQKVISNDISYITLITWEKMYKSKIISNKPIL